MERVISGSAFWSSSAAVPVMTASNSGSSLPGTVTVLLKPKVTFESVAFTISDTLNNIVPLWTKLEFVTPVKFGTLTADGVDAASS
jgi:hypothetical protein